jgi:hypothetical protein
MSQASVDLVRQCIDTLNAGEFENSSNSSTGVVADDAELRAVGYPRWEARSLAAMRQGLVPTGARDIAYRTDA